MAFFDPNKLHVAFGTGTRADGPVTPRRYTLTHSDATGDLFLAIAQDYDRTALVKLQARVMADEVLGEWIVDADGPRLVLHCRAQGGLPVFGTARMRCEIFRNYMPMVMHALRHADRELTEAHPELNEAPVVVRFHHRRKSRDHEEEIPHWGEWG